MCYHKQHVSASLLNGCIGLSREEDMESYNIQYFQFYKYFLWEKIATNSGVLFIYKDP